MKLINRILVLLIFIAIGNHTYGQAIRTRVAIQRTNANSKMTNVGAARKVELVKENFISRQLKLSPEEANKFIPLYRRYQQELTTVKIAKRINNSNAQVNGTEQIDRELAYEDKLVEIRRHYKDEFLKILPPQKVSEMYKSEREFNDELLNQLKERSVRAGD